jgi:hypothetical protein
MHWSPLAPCTLDEVVHQEAGKSIQFEAMSRPRKALAAEIGNQTVRSRHN